MSSISHEVKPQRERKRKPGAGQSEPEGTPAPQPLAKPTAPATSSTTAPPTDSAYATRSPTETAPAETTHAVKPQRAPRSEQQQAAPAVSSSAKPTAPAPVPSTAQPPVVRTSSVGGITLYKPDVDNLDLDYESDRLQMNFEFSAENDVFKCSSANPKEWAAAQTSASVSQGCVAFAIRIEKGAECRFGWGVQDCHMRLGVGQLSFGFDSSGVKVHNGTSEAYGSPFGVGDVVTAYLHLKSGLIAFEKNGADLGLAYRMPKALQGCPFFPHVMVRNAVVSVYLRPQPKVPNFPKALVTGFTWFGDAPGLLSQYDAMTITKQLKQQRPELYPKEQPTPVVGEVAPPPAKPVAAKRQPAAPKVVAPKPEVSVPIGLAPLPEKAPAAPISAATPIVATPTPLPTAAVRAAAVPVVATPSPSVPVAPSAPVQQQQQAQPNIITTLPGNRVSTLNPYAQPFIPWWFKDQEEKLLASRPVELTPPIVGTAEHALFTLRQNESKYSAKSKTMPSYFERERIVRSIVENKVTVISGGTGCGKTTLIPQFILDSGVVPEGKRIYCTQPRRISALTIPEYVAQERGNKVGEEVGYQIRFVNAFSQQTRIVFATTAILLRMLHSDPTLSQIGVLIVDEVHERDVYTEFLLLLVRQLLMTERANLKLVLMSATISAKDFADYFLPLATGESKSLQVVDIPGRLYPITTNYLEDALEWAQFRVQKPARGGGRGGRGGRGGGRGAPGGADAGGSEFDEPNFNDLQLVRTKLGEANKKVSLDTEKSLAFWSERDIFMDLIVALVHKFHNQGGSGAILIFLPGWGDIAKCHAKLQLPQYYVLCLHSMMSTEEQHKAFEPPPQGKRKIILSTNIAETSVTIDDVVFVIDSGVMKERVYCAPEDLSSLTTCLITRANATQRRGRAGRCQAGIVMHLFPSWVFNDMKEFPTPEMLSKSLEEVILQLKVISGGDVKKTLASSMAQPSEQTMDNAMLLLFRMSALTEKRQLTILGRALAALPVQPMVAKFILYGGMFRVLKPVAAIAAFLSLKSPFVQTVDEDDERGKKDFADEACSDHYVLVQAYAGWRAAVRKGDGDGFCKKFNLSSETMDMARLMVEQLVGFGVMAGYDGGDTQTDNTDDYCEVEFLPGPHSREWTLVKAALAFGFWPSILGAVPGGGRGGMGGGGSICWINEWGSELSPFRASLCAFLRNPPGQWMVFTDSMKFGRHNSMENTIVHTGYTLLACTKLQWHTNDVWMDFFAGQIPTASSIQVFGIRTDMHKYLKACLDARSLAVFPKMLVDRICDFLHNPKGYMIANLRATDEPAHPLATKNEFIFESDEK